MAVSKAEIDAFNRDFDMYEQWKYGVTENIKPQKVKPYNFYTDAPSEPIWFKNLQKAWSSTQRKKALKEAITERDSGVQLPSLDGVRQNPQLWKEYCNEHELKRKPGRPKLPPEQRKSQKGRIKRSDLMRKLLTNHGITVNKDNGLEPTSAYEGWVFLKNGRIRFENESSISVHAFIRDFC